MTISTLKLVRKKVIEYKEIESKQILSKKKNIKIKEYTRWETENELLNRLNKTLKNYEIRDESIINIQLFYEPELYDANDAMGYNYCWKNQYILVWYRYMDNSEVDNLIDL